MDRQTDRQTDTKTDRQTDKQTNMTDYPIVAEGAYNNSSYDHEMMISISQLYYTRYIYLSSILKSRVGPWLVPYTIKTQTDLIGPWLDPPTIKT